MSSEELWDEANRIEEILGTEELLFSLKKAMGDDLLEDLLAYICRCHDIKTVLKEKE